MCTAINNMDLIQTYALVKNMVICSDNTVINNIDFNSNLSLSE